MSRAILFPGQGSQFVGMGAQLHEALEPVRALYTQASEILGYDLGAVSFHGPEEELQRSDRTQPAIFTHSVAALLALTAGLGDARKAFTHAAGHSLGEWAALYFGGALSLDEALRALEARGRLMQECASANPGAMLAILGKHEAAQLESICSECGIQVANYNSPMQTVLSGTAEGIAQAEAKAGEAGLKAVRLPVAGAFHSRLMQEAAEAFSGVIAGMEFKAPSLPVLSNVTGAPHEDADAIRQRMVEQITGSVQWVRSVEYLQSQGVDAFVECGPGKVLSGLVKRIDKGAALHNIQTSDEADAFVASI